MYSSTAKRRAVLFSLLVFCVALVLLVQTRWKVDLRSWVQQLQPARRHLASTDADGQSLEAWRKGNYEAYEKKKLWWAMTLELEKAGVFNANQKVRKKSALRCGLDYYHQQAGLALGKEGRSFSRCGETGDGHFLQKIRSVCKKRLSVDLFDPAADIRLDLTMPPANAPQRVKNSFGSMDVMVSHQVFEHLNHPTIGMINLNTLLRLDGRLFFSTPFIAPDHQSPRGEGNQDHFRYTVRSVHRLLECGGFEVTTLLGIGSRLLSVFYLAGVGCSQTPKPEFQKACDGLTTNFCANEYYTHVFAVGRKIKNVNLEDMYGCFG